MSEACPKCGAPSTGRHKIDYPEENRSEEGEFFECGTMLHDDATVTQVINDCRINELTAQLSASQAEVERLRGACEKALKAVGIFPMPIDDVIDAASVVLEAGTDDSNAREIVEWDGLCHEAYDALEAALAQSPAVPSPPAGEE